MKFDTILLDGKNSIYRAVFAGHADERFMATGYDYSVVFFRFINSYVNLFKPSSLHIFWDTPSRKIWRKSVLPEYKEGRSLSRHDFDVEKVIKNCVKTCIEMAKCMGVYQYHRDRMEADDLIYAWCKTRRRNGRHVIISSDGDLLQIPYYFDNVEMYNPLLKGGGFIKIPDIDPTELKSFTGEKSDTIPGYKGIGPKRGAKLVEDLKWRHDFFEEQGRAIYDRNRKIIDLSLCPEVQENTNYISEVLSRPKKFNDKKAKKFAFRVRGLMAEYSRIISPFKFIGKNK